VLDVEQLEDSGSVIGDGDILRTNRRVELEPLVTKKVTNCNKEN
jgi:hypothetical protein